MARVKQIWLTAAVVSLSLLLAGCQEEGQAAADEQTLVRVVSTTSFGMCVGYCSTRLEITESEAVLTRQGRGGRGAVELPDDVIRASFDVGEWTEIKRLAAEAKFEGLGPVIGCPDCADGGAESLTVETSDGIASVSFEYGAKVEGLSGLLEKVRAKRLAMTPAEQ